MKKCFFIIVLLTYSFTLFAQKANSKQRGTIGVLQTPYHQAQDSLIFGSDSVQNNTFMSNYGKMTESLFVDYIKKDSLLVLEKGKNLVMHCVFYFNKTGKIDAIFYSVVTPLKEDQVTNLMASLSEFKDNYIFPQNSEYNFSQCGPMIFKY